mmetsp:Transcript_40397/g.94556  ORF Transcript_40397/g.94556 Transcript_40397/m.94556 type:complete len:133 (-) Transcript_40397:827-1225(-)
MISRSDGVWHASCRLKTRTHHGLRIWAALKRAGVDGRYHTSNHAFMADILGVHVLFQSKGKIQLMGVKTPTVESRVREELVRLVQEHPAALVRCAESTEPSLPTYMRPTMSATRKNKLDTSVVRHSFQPTSS